MKKLSLVLALVLLLLPLATARADFSTPEGTVEHFLQALSQGDWEGALSATDCYLVHGQAGASMAQSGAALAAAEASPIEDPAYAIYNQMILAGRLGDWADNIWWFLMFFEDYPDAYPSPLGFADPVGDAALFPLMVNPAHLASFHLVRADPMPAYLSQLAPDAQPNRLYLAALIYSSDDGLIFEGFSLVQAHDRWWITGMSADDGEDALEWGETPYPTYMDDEEMYLEWVAYYNGEYEGADEE